MLNISINKEDPEKYNDWAFSTDDYNLKALFSEIEEFEEPDNKTLGDAVNKLIEAYWEIAQRVIAVHKMCLSIDKAIARLLQYENNFSDIKKTKIPKKSVKDEVYI